MRTDTPRFIASQAILWLHADGTETRIEARIGEPYQVDARTWACPAALEGVDGRYPDIFGDGSMQALSLAMGLIATRLGHMLENDAQLVCPEDRSPWNGATFGAANPAARVVHRRDD